MNAPAASRYRLLIAAALFTAAWALWPVTPRAGLVYKNYIVQQDSGVDILCAPYTVKAGDWVIKILKLRGEIAAQDFPYFLQIFDRINPQVKDINRIRPGQQIFIPIRELPPGSFEKADSGMVTIPFVDLSARKTMGREAAATYKVRSGDTISRLISARYGRYGSSAYQDGIKQLKALNPRIKNLDLIFVDQVIFLPNPGTQVSRPEVLASAPVTARPIPKPAAPPKPAAESRPGIGTTDKAPPMGGISTLAEAAALMEADFLSTGSQSFPDGRAGAFQLDLSRTPVMDMPDGKKVLLTGQRPIEDADLTAIATQWKDFRQLSLPPNASLEQVLEAVLDTPEKGSPAKKTVQLTTGGVAFDIRPKWLLKGPETETHPIRHICITPIDGVHQRTPSGITRFLADHGIRLREVMRAGRQGAARQEKKPPSDRKAGTVRIAANDNRQLVADLLNAMGYPMTRNVAISFPYAGIEVKAMSNLVTTRSGNPLFIDFGDLFGDALTAIANTGFNIIQVNTRDDTAAVIDILTNALDEPVTTNVEFLAANRPKRYNTVVRIPGTLVGPDDGHRTLITTASVAPPIQQVLNDRQVSIVIVDKPAKKASTPSANTPAGAS
jgi:hypothetical protein